MPDIKLEIEFSQNEMADLCAQKCQELYPDTAGKGVFKCRIDSWGPATCTFVPFPKQERPTRQSFIKRTVDSYFDQVAAVPELDAEPVAAVPEINAEPAAAEEPVAATKEEEPF